MPHPHDLIGELCVVCGRRAQSKHHEPPKGMGGTKIPKPRLSLCGVGNENPSTCHGARHHNDLHFEHEDGIWHYVPKYRYAHILREIGVNAVAEERSLCRGQ